MAGKKLGRQQLEWGPRSRRKRSVRAHVRKAAARSLAAAIAVVLALIVLLVVIGRNS
jgi:hypothetical protein